MDYSSYYNAPQNYQFLGLPPTPIHTEPSGSVEDFRNSPSVRAPSFPSIALQIPQYPLPQSQQFYRDSLPHYSHSHHSYYTPRNYSPVSPVPHSASASFDASPVQASYHAQAVLTQSEPQDVYDQFQNFDFNPHFQNPNQNGQKPITPVQQSQQQKSQPSLQHKTSIGSNEHGLGTNGFDVNKFEPNAYSSENTLEENRSAGQQGSNSDDDDMTPAQSRRKAQNRAAQRAFRERKERHVKDLENKLLALENASKNLTTENERLKLQLQKASTENEILKATSSSHNRSPSPPTTSGPMHFSPTDFYSEVLQSHDNKTPSHRVVYGDDGGKLLAAGAAWDYIISHPLFLQGMVDVGDVSERLKTQARCDGQGPVFSESDIVRAIEASIASGSDELL